MSRAQRTAVDTLLRDLPARSSTTPPTVTELRAGFARLMASMHVPESIRTAEITLAGRPALSVEPTGPRRAGTILYVHGGAHIFGSPTTALGLTANLVVRTGIGAVSIDYRLAPEHPFPADVEDTFNAYRALLEAGTDPDSIAVAGDSAGGGLAVTSMLMAREAGLPLPAAVLTFSAGLDATRSGASMSAKEGVDPIFSRADLDRNGTLYRAGADPRQPLLSPAVLADLTGFPPMMLQVGGNELMLDDSRLLAARAADAGVDVILDVTADVPHVFQSFEGMLDEADQALDRAALFLRQHVSRTR